MKNIMSESFDMLLNREKNLTELTQLGASLSEDSKNYKKDAKNLRFSYMLKQYMTYIVVAIILIFLILLKIYVI